MSLLTEEQIHEVAAIFAHRRDANIATIFHAIKEWNEKQQPSTQFEPDWSKSPKYVVGAALNLAWLNENGNWTLGYQIAKYDRPEPVITPHPHAEIMAKYAEVAARRVDPWVEFQMRRNTIPDDRWINISGSTPHPRWEENMEYRHIGDDK